MAKATAPLFSLTASGALARTLVYDRRGFVRQYVIPANPKTDAQAEIRYPFMGMSAVVKVVGPNCKADIKAAAEAQGQVGYRWNAYLIGQALGKDYWSQKEAAFNTMTTAERGSWDSAATSAGINPGSLDYGTQPGHFPGLSLWVAAWALHDMGKGPGSAPDATNANDWANYITA